MLQRIVQICFVACSPGGRPALASSFRNKPNDCSAAARSIAALRSVAAVRLQRASGRRSKRFRFLIVEDSQINWRDRCSVDVHMFELRHRNLCISVAFRATRGSRSVSDFPAARIGHRVGNGPEPPAKTLRRWVGAVFPSLRTHEPNPAGRDPSGPGRRNA